MKLLASAALATALLAGAVQAQTVGGIYNVAGTNPDGSAYTGTAQITPSSGATCRIAWTTGPTTSDGVCMLANKALAAFYKLGDDFGLVVYELQPDGSLKGYWTIADKDGVGGEVLTPRK
jgi:hypothetical protein